MAPVTKAEVRLHGARVGELRFEKGGSEFRYEDDLSSPEHQTLGQIFEDEPRSRRRARIGVPAWFSNLLPEGELRRQVIREMGGGNIGNFTLLLRLGRHLPGAVTVHGEDEPDDDWAPDPAGGSLDHPLRHSLAGVQLKYSVSSKRLTTRVSGDGGSWIVKLPDRSLRDLPTNEYLTMRWLAAAGFPVPPVDLIPADQVQGLPAGLVAPDDLLYVIERFDRAGPSLIHVEDFAQVGEVEPRDKYSESGYNYDGLATLILERVGVEGYQDFVRRLVAMIIIGNTDAHLKNWAFIYRDGRTPTLAPVYDFHSLTIYSTYRYTPLALSLNEQKLPGALTVDDFRRMAVRAGADPDLTAVTVNETISRLRDAWDKESKVETAGRFAALSAHFEQRLSALSLCASI